MLTRITSLGLFLFSFISFINPCDAQSKQFQHFTSADGLSQSEVYSFFEDRQGYMWIGTVDGLNRYDGYDVTIFHTDKDNSNSISNNTIRSLAEDDFGRIWIGTDDGLSVYDPELEKIHQVPLVDFEESRLTINSIAVAEGRLHLGTNQGLLLIDVQSDNLDPTLLDVEIVYRENDSEPYAIVASVVGAQGEVWLATSSELFMLYGQDDGRKSILKNILDLSETLPDIRNIAEDRFGNIWIVSHDNGFLRYNSKGNTVKYFKRNSINSSISSNKISGVVTDKNGDLWIGTHDMGLMYLESKYLNDDRPIFKIIEHDPYNDRSLNSNLVYSLFVSNNNLLWIGTIGSGINIYDPNRKPFQYYSLHNPTDLASYNTNFIRAVYADEKDNIWIGTHNNGLFYFDRYQEQDIKKVGFGSESIFHIIDAGNGRKLICSGQGVSLIRTSNNQVEEVSHLPIGPSFYITQTQTGNFWIASLDGLKQCKLVGNQLILEQEYSAVSNPAISFNNCRVLLYNNLSNELFVGTEGGGLNRIQLDNDDRPLRVDVYQHQDSSSRLSNNYIRSILKDTKGDFWIGTYEGLNRMMVNADGTVTFKSYTGRDGLPNHTIQSIVEDIQGNLWIGTNNGLCKFEIDTETFTQYAVKDGIQSNEFSEHTSFITPKNEIIIGGINGVNTFYPEQITSNDFEPNTTLTDFYIFNKRVGVEEEISDGVMSPLSKSISLTDSIFLHHSQNSFGFNFSAMTYNSPDKVQYAYILEGFDTEWNFTNAYNRRANYTNIGYGDYVFSVKATNNDGKWEESPRQVFVSIKTPFYLSTMAFVSYGILAMLAFIFFTNYSILKYTTKNKIILENQHNKKVRELEELRTRFFINISHDLRTPLTLISGPLDVIMQKKGIPEEVYNLLNLIQRNVRKLRDMTEQLLDIGKVEGGQLNPKYKTIDISDFIKNETSYFENAFKEKGVQLKVRNDITEGHVSFDPDMISKVMFNMLSNALKHTPEGQVKVIISRTSIDSMPNQYSLKYDNYIGMHIQDSGDGIDDADLGKVFDRFYQGKNQNKKGYGVGLSHSRDLIEAHDGKVFVQSTKGEGATFSFYIPDIIIEGGTAEDIILATKQEPADYSSVDDEIALVSEEMVLGTKAMRILLVEDNPDLRSFIASELSKSYKVIEAEDGEQGLALAKSDFPDLILSDVMMPNMDGMEFCKAIKSNIKSSHIPVILLTAKVDKEAKYQGLEIGADDYISKPFEMEYLLLRIRNLLQNRDRLRKMFQGNFQLEPSKVTVTSIDEEFLSNLMTAIEKGIPDASFSITSLERELGMSHASFYNKIKNLTGQSAKELVVSVRMKRARQILEDTSNIRVSEVAYMVGFTDPKYFSKRFKDYFGMSPSEIAKNS